MTGWYRIPVRCAKSLTGDHKATRMEATADLLGRWHLGENPGVRELMRVWLWSGDRVVKLRDELLAWAKEWGATVPDEAPNKNGQRPDTDRTLAGHAGARQTPESRERSDTDRTATGQRPDALHAGAFLDETEDRRREVEPFSHPAPLGVRHEEEPCPSTEPTDAPTPTAMGATRSTSVSRSAERAAPSSPYPSTPAAPATSTTTPTPHPSTSPSIPPTRSPDAPKPHAATPTPATGAISGPSMPRTESTPTSTQPPRADGSDGYQPGLLAGMLPPPPPPPEPGPKPKGKAKDATEPKPPAAPKPDKPEPARCWGHAEAIAAFIEEHGRAFPNDAAYPLVWKGRNHDGTKAKVWLSAANIRDESHVAAGIERLRKAMRAYFDAVKAGAHVIPYKAKGEPPSTEVFTDKIVVWLQLGDGAEYRAPVATGQPSWLTQSWSEAMADLRRFTGASEPEPERRDAVDAYSETVSVEAEQ